MGLVGRELVQQLIALYVGEIYYTVDTCICLEVLKHGRVHF